MEPKGSDLCAAVMTLSSRGMPLAVLVPRCDESPTAYSDATQSSARTGMLSKQNTNAAINRRMRDPRFNWLDAPRVELKFAASQQNAAARQQLPLIKRAAAVLVPKPVLVATSPLARRKRSARKSLKQRRCYCVGASLQAVRRPHFQIASLEERDAVSDSVPILRAGRDSDFHPPHRRVMGFAPGPNLLKTKRTIQKETRDHFFFLFVSPSNEDDQRSYEGGHEIATLSSRGANPTTRNSRPPTS